MDAHFFCSVFEGNVLIWLINGLDYTARSGWPYYARSVIRPQNVSQVQSTLIVKATNETNNSAVQCVAFSFDARPTEYSDAVQLIVQGNIGA